MMLQKPNLESLSPEQSEYVANLERRIDGSGILAREISLLKSGLAHDLQLIRAGEQGDNYEFLKYVCLDRLSPKYNLVKVLLTNIKLLEEDPKLAVKAKKDKDAEVTTMTIAGELEIQPIVEHQNVFEMMSKKIAGKNERG